MKYDYDIIVIGGGSGGLTAAKTARGFGKRVAIIEKDKLGGECTWTGCIPSKTLIKCAQIAFNVKHAKQYGLRVSDSALDTAQVMDHVRTVVQQVYEGETPAMFEKEGIEVIKGEAQFRDNHTIELNHKKITAKQFIVATGSLPFVPPIPGLAEVSYLTNQTLFDIKTLPTSMIILGGGPIGIEMASALNRLGVAITVVEMKDRILQHDDVHLVEKLTQMLREEGVTIKTGYKATAVSQKGNEVQVTCVDANGNASELTAQSLLVAVGRVPNVADLNLSAVGVETNKKGIVVNDTLRTTAKNIYACGDVVGPYRFTHVAWYQAVTAVRNALIPLFKQKVSYDDIIWVTFTAPELASAGLTEERAREKFKDIKVFTLPYTAIDRSFTDGTTDGIAKYICDAKGRLIGMHILGAQAGDIIHEVQLAKAIGTPLQKIGSVMHAYPTYSELNWQAGKRAYVEQLLNSRVVQFFKRLI